MIGALKLFSAVVKAANNAAKSLLGAQRVGTQMAPQVFNKVTRNTLNNMSRAIAA